MISCSLNVETVVRLEWDCMFGRLLESGLLVVFECPVRPEWPVILDCTLALEGPEEVPVFELERDGTPGRGDGGALDAGVELGPVPRPRPNPAFEFGVK